MKTLKRLYSILLALLLCVTTLATTIPVFAEEEDEKVYSSADELYADIRVLFKEHRQEKVEFLLTEELFYQVCEPYEYYPGQYQFEYRKVFDFYGDQSGLAPNEGDYLDQNYYGGISTSASTYFYSVTIETTGLDYCTTLQQEATFENKLASLFATGGPLASAKNMSDYDKVVACMNYIRANVVGKTSYDAIRHTAYSALCEGTATCQGIALLFYRMLRELGIPNRILMGMDAGAHTYNIVMLDGKYYYCDASSGLLLKGSNSFTPAQLQEHYLTNRFKENVLSKISATDYPAPANSGNGDSSNSGDSGAGSSNSDSSNNGNSSGNSGVQSHTHDFSEEYTSDATHHWFACSCGEIKEKEEHIAGEWVVDKEATCQASGIQSKSCTSCGYVMETKEIEKLTAVEYKVLDGADSTYRPGDEEFSLRAEGELEKFVNIEVDGNVVDEKNYTVKSGSTIITFTNEFMDTLSSGEHTVTFNFTDGFANASIIVANTDDEINNDASTGTLTPDSNKGDKGSSTLLFVVLGVGILAAGAIVVFVMFKKRNNFSE